MDTTSALRAPITGMINEISLDLSNIYSRLRSYNEKVSEIASESGNLSQDVKKTLDEEKSMSIGDLDAEIKSFKEKSGKILNALKGTTPINEDLAFLNAKQSDLLEAMVDSDDFNARDIKRFYEDISNALSKLSAISAQLSAVGTTTAMIKNDIKKLEDAISRKRLTQLASFLARNPYLTLFLIILAVILLLTTTFIAKALVSHQGSIDLLCQTKGKEGNECYKQIIIDNVVPKINGKSGSQVNPLPTKK